MTTATPRHETPMGSAVDSSLYNFGLPSRSHFAPVKYDNHLMPVAWRVRVNVPGEDPLIVKTCRVGLIGVTVVLPRPVMYGTPMTLTMDLPVWHAGAPSVPIGIEGPAISCVLRGREGFRVHVSTRRYTNPQHRDMLDRYMHDRQDYMVFLPA